MDFPPNPESRDNLWNFKGPGVVWGLSSDGNKVCLSGVLGASRRITNTVKALSDPGTRGSWLGRFFPNQRQRGACWPCHTQRRERRDQRGRPCAPQHCRTRGPEWSWVSRGVPRPRPIRTQNRKEMLVLRRVENQAFPMLLCETKTPVYIPPSNGSLPAFSR